MKKQVKKLKLAKETLQMLDLGKVSGGSGLSCPDESCFPYRCPREAHSLHDIC